MLQYNLNDHLSKEYLNLIKVFNTNPEDILIIGNVVDLEKYFQSIIDPIILNHIPQKSKYMEIITSLICDTNDRSSMIISCRCGKYKGFFYEGKTCEECNTTVASNLVHNLKNEVWIQVPESIGKVLNPLVYYVIGNILKYGNSSTRNYLEFVLDVSKPLPDDLKPYFKERGFKFFYENFDYVMDVFLNRYPKTKNRKYNKVLQLFLEKYRDRLFTQYLPILSRFLQPSTNPNNNKMYIDKSLKEILKSIISLVMSKYTYIIDKSYKSIEKLMWKIYYSYTMYYYQIIQTKFSKKKSYFRKNIFGSRLHFTFRNVIAPINDEHIADEIHIPWKTGITNLQFHILNILVNRIGMSTIDAYNFVMNGYYNYHPLLDQIFQLLIIESYFKGIPAIQNRNPSLLTSNIILHFITKVGPEITRISKRFIQHFGRIQNIDDKVISDGSIIHDIRDIFKSRIRIIKQNEFDTPETIFNFNIKEGITDHRGKYYSEEDLKYAIDNKTVQVSYLDLILLNGDFDGSDYE